ncbi:MAG TPA: aspartate kinase [Candidatus Onthenecus intestinigallinarum]|uniref:Aspartokinase n=1 Tax=Candidatus Onthenecus intestinigallinarum TaxID=2840875 RepID=A0A9D1CR76_9FIRM|nr:aspartate kinase [Candidatus Onthenecus intestinigallinarum]
MKEIRVSKFGGSSLADAGQFAKVREILLSNPSRRYVVPSAPGKRTANDEKITDMLYECHRLAQAGEDFSALFERIADRYRSIADSLSLDVPLEELFRTVRAGIENSERPDYAASRGEYLNGILLSAYLGWDFIDAADGILFDADGKLDQNATQDALSALLREHEYAVVPGFYGSMPDGTVHTFSRGGSDISGAIVARAAHADLYENWTDVNGCLMADPRIVRDPKPIRHVTYRELRELSYMGASVLHEEAIFPVRMAGIPTNIRNTNAPEEPGTLISHDAEDMDNDYVITGIAGSKDFAIVTVEKAMMNAELGFGRRVLQAVEENGISFEHLPTGIDTMCVVCHERALDGKRDKLVHRIYELTDPDSVEIHSGLALIATVGRGMVRSKGTSARLFNALQRAGINVRMIDQGSSELNIIVGVDNLDFENAVRAIYRAFVTEFDRERA